MTRRTGTKKAYKINTYKLMQLADNKYRLLKERDKWDALTATNGCSVTQTQEENVMGNTVAINPKNVRVRPSRVDLIIRINKLMRKIQQLRTTKRG